MTDTTREALLSTYRPDTLRGKTALVTGGSRGIGRAICVGLGTLGAKVIINYAGNVQAAEETARLVTEAGGSAVLARFDVADFQAVQDAVKALEKEHGGVDILVNNAGIAKDGLIARHKEEDWDAVVDTNLKGSFNCIRAVSMGMMKKRYGKIINISSVIGIMGNAGQAAYAASKAGVFGLTKSVAREFSSRNIQVNCVAPGYISTDMTQAYGEKLIEEIKAKIPLDRLGEPSDIARAVAFLATPASDYVTGQVLAVDGGMTM